MRKHGAKAEPGERLAYTGGLSLNLVCSWQNLKMKKTSCDTSFAAAAVNRLPHKFQLAPNSLQYKNWISRGLRRSEFARFVHKCHDSGRSEAVNNETRNRGAFEFFCRERHCLFLSSYATRMGRSRSQLKLYFRYESPRRGS